VRRRFAAVSVLALSAALAGCGGSGAPQATGPSFEVTAAWVSGVGRVLVDGQGYTLYMFVPDAQDGSTCYGACAAQWPPLLLPAGVAAPERGPGARASLLGTTRRRDGRLQVTYAGWPLYRWIGDTAPGMATGQGLDNLGGFWYVLDPAGSPIRR